MKMQTDKLGQNLFLEALKRRQELAVLKNSGWITARRYCHEESVIRKGSSI
jgi:hypothetical protein